MRVDWRFWLPLGGLLLVVLMWSGNTIVSKVIMREASPVVVSLVRFQLVGLLFYLPVFVLAWRDGLRLSRDEWLRLSFLGVVGTAGSQVFFMIGLRTTPAVEAGIYQILTPLFVVLIAWIWLHDRLTRQRLLGIVVAGAGAGLLLTGGGSVGLGGGDLVGALFIMGSDFVWALYTVMIKPLTTRRSPLIVLTVANLTAMLAVWPMAALFGAWPELPTIPSWSLSAWAVIAYLVLITGTTSQWLYSWTIREIGPSRVSAGLYLKPLFVGGLGILLLAEAPTWLTLVSGLLILAGVWLVNRPQRPRRAAARALAEPAARSAAGTVE